jgi:hypothetical protein
MPNLPEEPFISRNPDGQYYTLAFWACSCQENRLHPYTHFFCDRCGSQTNFTSGAPVKDVLGDPEADHLLLEQVKIGLTQEVAKIVDAALTRAANQGYGDVISRLEKLEAYLTGEC